MNIQQLNLSDLKKPDAELTVMDKKLKKISKEFEEVFVSTLLKEGLKTANALNDDDEKDKSSQAYLDMAHSQMAKVVAAEGLTGIADSIYQDLRSSLGRQ